MKIGDRVFVRGYIDEIRKDTVIVRNDGGYFGTVLSEVTGELPSAQPEPCEDAVSRTELRHIFEEHCYPVHYDHNSVDVGMTLPGIVEVLNIAPSVTSKRKTGKWVYKPNEYDDSTYECSQCEEPWTLIDGTPEENNMKFCPNCGTDMRGDEDG